MNTTCTAITSVLTMQQSWFHKCTLLHLSFCVVLVILIFCEDSIKTIQEMLWIWTISVFWWLTCDLHLYIRQIVSEHRTSSSSGLGSLGLLIDRFIAVWHCVSVLTSLLFALHLHCQEHVIIVFMTIPLFIFYSPSELSVNFACFLCFKF